MRKLTIYLGRNFAVLATAIAAAFSSIAAAVPSDDFVITVQTDNAGTSGANQFTIPTTGTGYNFSVDCDNDGTDEVTGATGDYTCDYGAAGTYTVRIKDNSGVGTGFPRIYFNDSGDKLKLLTIERWGSMHWASMASAFYGCANLAGQASDVPNLGSVTDLSWMFAYASAFNQAINAWDTSTITNMSSMFNNAGAFNRDLSNWNTANVTDMAQMFANTTVFNQAIGGWNTAKVTTMRAMFAFARAFNQPLASWDTGQVTDMSIMFTFTPFNQDISLWNTANVTDMSGMFAINSSFNGNISAWNTAKVTNMQQMFYYASSFNQDIGIWNTAAVTTMEKMFENASQFDQDLGAWDIANVTNMTDIFLNVTLSTPNYDDLLADWSAQTVQSGISFNGGNSTYCESGAARTSLINSGWTITDAGQNCVAVNGVCGASNGLTLLVMPTTNLCAAGSASAVSGAGPWSWTCDGRYGGTSASCSANVQTYSISTAANPAAGGTMDCTPNPVNHGSNSSCAASPNGGYLFVGFSGDCNGSACNLTNVTANKSVTANFREQTGNVFYHPITPCRLADTRIDSRGGAFGQQTIREFNAVPEAADLSSFGGNPAGCGIPPWAVAVHTNFTAVGPPVSGYLRTWAWGQSEPNATLFAWPPTFGATNAATVPVCQGDSCDYDINVKIYSSQPIDLVIDAVGYYSP